MYNYHDSDENKKRLIDGRCRCGIEHDGRVFPLPSLVRDGELYDPYANASALGCNPTVPEDAAESYRPGRYIYAVGNTNEMRIALDCDRDDPKAIKHESLFHNEDVKAAGEIFFEDGMVARIDDQSGSYGTRGALMSDPSFVESVLTAMTRHHVPIKPELLQMLSDRLESNK